MGAALKLVIDLRRSLQLFFQAVCADKRRRTIHLVEIADLLGDLDVRVFIVQFLGDQILAEYAAKFFRRHGLTRSGI